MTNIKFPEVTEPQFVILQSEVDTGVVLTEKLERFLGKGTCYIVFNSFEEAKVYAKKVVQEKPKVECLIYDSAQQVVETIQNYQYLDSLSSATKEKSLLKKVLGFFRRN